MAQAADGAWRKFPIIVLDAGPRFPRIIARAPQTSGGTGGSAPARCPEVAQLPAHLHTCRCPVSADLVAQLVDVALQVEFVLLQPGDVQLLTSCTALQLARYVAFVITNDPVGTLLAAVLSEALWERSRNTHLVMMPVVLTPSVLCVTKNLPFSLIGL